MWHFLVSQHFFTRLLQYTEESSGLLCVHAVHCPARWETSRSFHHWIQWVVGPVVGLEIFLVLSNRFHYTTDVVRTLEHPGGF